jgi:hypothetical protein
MRFTAAPPQPSRLDRTVSLSNTDYVVIAVAVIVVGTIVLFFFCRCFSCGRRIQPAAPAPFHEYAREQMVLLPAEPD